MVAVTGDLVDGSVRELSAHVAPLAELQSRHGTFFVTGNHEYYSGAAPWVAELRRLGLRVLMNEHVVVRHEGAEMVVAGVTDFGAHHFDPAQRSDPQAALAGAPSAAGPRVLLAHQPRSAEAAERAGFDLQLSGHTHGGQFWPWNLFVPLQQPFTAGLNRLRRLWVYTSRGTGYWGPPKRFGAPSEITRLRLVGA
jgi:predicted MPP superfamily phosphohydrolase